MPHKMEWHGKVLTRMKLTIMVSASRKKVQFGLKVGIAKKEGNEAVLGTQLIATPAHLAVAVPAKNSATKISASVWLAHCIIYELRCIAASARSHAPALTVKHKWLKLVIPAWIAGTQSQGCLLYTSDAADE